MSNIINQALETQKLTSLRVLKTVTDMHNFWVKRIVELDVAADPTELQKQCAMFGVIEDIADTLDAINKKMAALKALMANKILPQGFDTVNVPKQYVGDVEYTMATRVTGSFTDKQKGFEWLEEIGEGGMITRTVHSQTLSAFLKRYVEGEALTPPEFVKVNTLEYVKRKGKTKAQRTLENVE